MTGFDNDLRLQKSWTEVILTIGELHRDPQMKHDWINPLVKFEINYL